MNSIIRLQTEDFHVDAGTKGPILCTGIKGMTLVMFFSPLCDICKDLFPKFQRLPQVITGCNFCTLNINENRQIIAMSKQTISPIQYVPHIVFFVNSRPFLQYDDDTTLEKLMNFVTYAMKLVESKKSFIDRGVKIESDIPKYSIAKPYHELKCEGDFCYLTFQDAYKGAKAQIGAAAPSPGGVMEQSPPQYFQRS